MNFAARARLAADRWTRFARPRQVVHASAARLAATIRTLSRASADGVLAELRSSPEGLAQSDVEERFEKHGPNRIAREQPPGWYVQLYHSFSNPFVLLLLVLAVVSFATGDRPATVIIGVMVLVSVLLRFAQERRSLVAAEKLRALVKVTAAVVRRDENNAPRRAEIPIEEIVPGDLVHLSAGDMVPADVRILACKDLFVSQAVLTGESLPVEKFAPPDPAATGTILDSTNFCFLGTNIVSGTATAVCATTGAETYLGSLARRVVGQRAPTSFEKGVQRISYLLIRFTLVMTALVFVINGLSKHDWSEAFLFALSVAVGLTPEMLPMIVSGTLALGAVAMSRRKVIVKRLNAIQDIGAIDILCTDKTGTLTQDKVILELHCDLVGNEDEDVLQYAYLNSFHQTGLKNLLDKAILDHREVEVAGAVKIDEIPFDFVRRMMSVVIERDGRRQLITKGAPEQVIQRCNRFELEGEVFDLGQLLLPDLREQLDQISSDGFRVLAIAYKEVDSGRETYSKTDEGELILKGYVAFLDPPKDSAAQAIAALGGHGVQVKILTGDNDLITRKICKEVGIRTERIVLGHEIDAVEDIAKLGKLAEASTVFARLTPAHKERLVEALRAAGHVVGFMGDGINDAPALRAADVGISVDNAVDIAKESADLILLEKSLLVLEDAVLEGRRVFGNIVKYIKMGTSSNFGNMFSVLGASIFLPFLPMLPIQLLIQNLLYDFSQLAIPFDRVDEEYLKAPRRWDVGDVARFMVFIGPVSSVFDYTTFLVMYFVFHANTPATQSLFQSGWFVEGLLSQTLIVHMIRTRRIPFLQSRAVLPLILSTAIIMGIGIALPFAGLPPAVGLVALPRRYFGWLAVTLMAYMVLTQVVKGRYIRRYGYV